jgi:transcriptional regulator with XRE-family HTH domain
MQSGGGVVNVFGNKIKRLREEKNMSIRMLAQEIGVSSGQISKYENAIHEPTYGNAFWLSILHCNKKSPTN